MAQTQKWTGSTFVSLLHETLTDGGAVKVKRSELRQAVQEVFERAVRAGANGQRVRFPVIGALAWREVKARKAGLAKNPFTGQMVMVKARPAGRKPRWSFPKAVREAFLRQVRKAA